MGERLPSAYFYDVDDVRETDHDHSGGDIDDDPTPDNVDDPDNDGSADNDTSLDDQLEQFIDDINAVLDEFYRGPDNVGPDDDGPDESDPGDVDQ